MNTLQAKTASQTASQIRTKIRKTIGLPDSGKMYFNQQEIITIVKIVNPKWIRQPKLDKDGIQVKNIRNQLMWETPQNNILPEAVPSWTRQGTIGSHPNVANLKNILSQLKKVKNAKASPLMQDIRAASQIVAQSKQQVKLNCDGEFDLRNLVISVLSGDPGLDINICYDIV